MSLLPDASDGVDNGSSANDGRDLPPAQVFNDVTSDAQDDELALIERNYEAQGQSLNPATDAAARSLLAMKHAPIAWIHANEAYMPLSAETFLEHSDLKFSHNNCRDDLLDSTPSVGEFPSTGNYHHQLKSSWPSCNHEGGYFNSADFSMRAYEKGGPPKSDGMYLNLSDNYRDGRGFQGDEPMYYAIDYNRKVIVYWLPWGFSKTRLTGPFGSHEGDWERIAIAFTTSWKPYFVQYFYHHDSCMLPWDYLPRRRQHPKLVIAKGSHGSYPYGDETEAQFGIYHDTIDVDTTTVWYGNNNPKIVPNWYYFTGGWGRVGRSKNTTGPMGPNPQTWSQQAPLFNVNNCPL